MHTRRVRIQSESRTTQQDGRLCHALTRLHILCDLLILSCLHSTLEGNAACRHLTRVLNITEYLARIAAKLHRDDDIYIWGSGAHSSTTGMYLRGNSSPKYIKAKHRPTVDLPVQYQVLVDMRYPKEIFRVKPLRWHEDGMAFWSMVGATAARGVPEILDSVHILGTSKRKTRKPPHAD